MLQINNFTVHVFHYCLNFVILSIIAYAFVNAFDMNKTKECTVLIADDHAIVRFGLGLLLKEVNTQTKCFEATSYEQARDILAEQPVDLLILDIHMPGGDNIKSVEDFKVDFPQVKILIFSSYPEKIYAARYIKAGADGYLHKDATEDSMKKVITAVLRGELLALMHEECKDTLTDETYQMSTLSDRELDVAKLLADGLGNLEIANSLSLQMSTVSTYKKRVFDKLNVNNISELIQKLTF